MNEGETMKPAPAVFQVLKKKIFGALLLVVCLSTLTMAQSVLSDDAHTSTLPKDLDANFGTNPNLRLSRPAALLVLRKRVSETRAFQLGHSVTKDEG